MAHGSERSAHREWIRLARAQADEAERSAGAGGPQAGAGRVFSADFLPGYTLEAEIHRGAQGAVYRALQHSTGRRVAVKILHEHALGDPLERARFEREVRVLGTLQHPNIVTIHDGGTREGRFYLVMDYIAGHPLDVHMAGERRGIRETLELFATICEAVDAAHVRGIIHRDLKPANVRVDAGGEPHVLDFGLAKLTVEARGIDPVGDVRQAVTLTGHFLGSLPWAAPEQAEGSPTRIDIRTDVYALGVIAYQMLTGKFPYPVSGPIKEALEAIVHREPASPREIRTDIDDELETIVLKCLSKERERRYQTAGELARDVRRYLAGAPIEAKRDSTFYVLRKTVQRHRTPLTALAAFVILLIASSIFAWGLSVKAHEAAGEARRAELAARKSEELGRLRLRDSLVAQARATRRSGQMGQRFEALDALEKAAAIAPTQTARNEAIAAMALPDLRLVKQLTHKGQGYFDDALQRCAILDEQEGETVVRVADEEVLAKIPPPEGGSRETYRVVLRGDYLTRVFDPPTGNRRLEVWTVDSNARLHMQLADVPYQGRFDVSGDGKRLAVARLDQAIHIYDIASEDEIQRIPLERNPAYMSFDPEGRRLALFHGNFTQARILDLDTGVAEAAFGEVPISWAVAWSPNGDVVAGAAFTHIELWNVRTRKSCGRLEGHQAQIVYIMFSHDGSLLASYSWDGAAFIWDARSLRPLLQLRLALPTFSPDDRRLGASAVREGTMYPLVFEFDPGAERRRLVGEGNNDVLSEGHGGFDPTSAALFLGQYGPEPDARGVCVFETATGKETDRSVERSIWSMQVDTRGRFALGATEDGLMRWPIIGRGDAATLGQPELIYQTPQPRVVALSRDGATAVVGDYNDSEFAIVDVGSGAARRVNAPWRALRVRISPDGHWAVMDSIGGNVTEIWDLVRGELAKTLPGCYRDGATFSPEGERLLLGRRDGLATYDVGTWRERQVVPGAYWMVRFTPDGKLLACALDLTTVRLLDGKSYGLVAELEPPERYSTTDLEFSPDGKLLAQFVNHAGVVHLWDLGRIRERLRRMGLDWSDDERMKNAKCKMKNEK